MPPQRNYDDVRIARLEEQDSDLRERTARIEEKLDHVVATLDKLADDVRATKALEPRVVALEGVETRRRGRRKWLAGVAASAIAALLVLVAKTLAGL